MGRTGREGDGNDANTDTKDWKSLQEGSRLLEALQLARGPASSSRGPARAPTPAQTEFTREGGGISRPVEKKLESRSSIEEKQFVEICSLYMMTTTLSRKKHLGWVGHFIDSHTNPYIQV